MAYNTGIFRDNTSLWVEKYRPKTLAEYLTDSELREKLQSFIKNEDIPHLLLEGTAGTGKSSLANLLVRNIHCDFKYINASEERGIDTVRNIIMQFCMTTGFAPLKIMVLDEFSEFTADAQNALRSVMEQYSSNTRFILTCNNVERIIEPIRSRCQEFKILPPSKADVVTKCESILKEEKIDYEKDELESIVDLNYPDIRKTIQYLQQQTTNKVLKMSKEHFRFLKYQDTIVSNIKTVTDKNIDDKVGIVRQMLADSRVKSYVPLIKHLYKYLEDYCPKDKRIKVLARLQEGQKCDPVVPDKEINIASTILDICEIIITK